MESRESTRATWCADIRNLGAMKGIISTIDLDDESLVAKARASPGLIGRDLTLEVMAQERGTWEQGLDHTFLLPPLDPVTQTVIKTPVDNTPMAGARMWWRSTSG